MNYIIILLLASMFTSIIINFIVISKLSKLIKNNYNNVNYINNIPKPKTNGNKKNRVVIRTEEKEAQMFEDIKNKEGWR